MSTDSASITTSDAIAETNAKRGDAPSVGSVNFGDLGRSVPISRKFGFDRGLCIDRFYIENFLAQHATDIHGRVLEVADNAYTKRFGADRVTTSDVLHATADNRHATIVGDLTRSDDLPSEAFDCVILTQTMQHLYDVRGSLTNIRHTLRPGGVALITVPGISQISRYDMDRWGDFWRFTTLSLERLLKEVFPDDTRTVCAHGNVRAAVAFLHGLCVEDVGEASLLDADEDYQLLLTVRIRKSDAST